MILTRLASPAGQDLGVRLLAPEEACDFEYWAARLVHVELLRNAVAVALYRLPLLAVPAGMGRRGGRMDMGFAGYAELAARELHGRPGFHGVAAVGTDVVWGEPVPQDLPPDARRQFFGLHAQPQNRPLTAYQWQVRHA
ncbi:DUF6302 family protein [Streptomyces filamentosus]|uniref:Uncharacterized protein n=1 Tax=Streptomyces filamentosus TaxID=67294 RepID=A0A919BSD7_STRFL|nr:DUF6302 family protein [Streptomyces filamentosus]GHG12791.1 hypothetical protein GCM10017667_52980 [Streptomyces filamentosus]